MLTKEKGRVIFQYSDFLVTAEIKPLTCESDNLNTTSVTLFLWKDNISEDNNLPIKTVSKTITHRGDLTTTVINAIFCVTDTASRVIGGLYVYNLRKLLSED